MVSEDYLGLNAQLVLAVSHNSNCEVLFSNYNEFIQLVTFQSNPIQSGFLRAHLEQAVIVHACHGHTLQLSTEMSV